MSWYNRVLNYFVRDSAERRRFIDQFNGTASIEFQSLLVNSLLYAEVCSGSEDNSYRHDLSAPKFVSGFAVNVKAGSVLTKEEILFLARIILMDETIMRKMFVLHWDTFIVRDIRTGAYGQWRIKDFCNFGGLLNFHP